MSSSEPPDNLNFLDFLKSIVTGLNLKEIDKEFTAVITILLLLIAAAFVGVITFPSYFAQLVIGAVIVLAIIFKVWQYAMKKLAYEDRDRERKHEKIKDTLPPTPQETPAPPPENGDDVTSQEWERRYLQHLMNVCEYPSSMALVNIKEAGIGSQKLALESIFTSLDVPAPQTERDTTHLAINLEKMDPDERGKLKRETALAAISREENKKLVILGAPGSGKSTLMNYLTLCLSGDRLIGEHGAQVSVSQEQLRQYDWGLSSSNLWPVRVILREYAARGLSQGDGLWEFVEAELSHPDIQLGAYAPLLKKRLQEKGGIILLDGLDEVDKGADVRQSLKKSIELFVRDFPRVRTLVTSRPYAYGDGWELHDFKVTRLLSLSEEQIQFFIEQWYAVMGTHDPTLTSSNAKRFSESLVHQTKHISNLREMAQRPLLLTMMVHIHRGREGGRLPERREELYRLSVKLLLDLWRRSKTIDGEETKTLVDELGIDDERLETALAEVAYTAHHGQREQQQTADIAGER